MLCLFLCLKFKSEVHIYTNILYWKVWFPFSFFIHYLQARWVLYSHSYGRYTCLCTFQWQVQGIFLHKLGSLICCVHQICIWWGYFSQSLATAGYVITPLKCWTAEITFGFNGMCTKQMQTYGTDVIIISKWVIWQIFASLSGVS